MFLRRRLVLSGLLLVSGCLYQARERTDQMVCDLAAQSYDPALPYKAQSKADSPAAPEPAEEKKPSAALPTDVETTHLMQARPNGAPPTTEEVRPVSQARPDPKVEEVKKKFDIPQGVPGRDAPPVPSGPWANPEEKRRDLRRFYPELPPLPQAPKPLPGPNGEPYTLAELQALAAKNSPDLRQKASDVEAARGNLIQATAYPNPTLIYQATPSNDGSTAGLQGFTIDQTFKTAGKLRLAGAAAQKDLDNAELALKRARGDLATRVRGAYFALLVSAETVRVTAALARFTDNVYSLQLDMALPGAAAPYEPAALRAQAYLVRLALKQAIQNYVYDWKQLAAVIGERQLPLSEVAGRIDAVIPNYDYDRVLNHALRRHTDVLTAYNGLDKARALLKLQQVTPVPDVEIQLGILKEFALAPQQVVGTGQVSVPIPIWDQNKGAIRAAEAALVRATEEPHRVETTLTNNLAAAYNNYKNALDGLEYYRKYILPDQVRTYQNVYLRRGTDPGVVFGDVVAAQQTLVTNVSTYLTILGQLWTAAVAVADFLQTDDLFQLAEPKELPPLPDLEHLRPWPCCHTCAAGAACGCSPAVVREGPRVGTTTPARRQWDTLPPAPIGDPTSQRPPQTLPKLDGPIPLPRPSRASAAD